MRSVAPLTDGSRTPGVYRVLGDPASMKTALAEAGWAPAVLPPTSTTHEFYDAIAAALSLPDYFGRNLDALWDCLGDLDTPTALIVTDWTRFARARPDRWRAILTLLTERCEQPPAFAVVLA